MRSGLPGTVYNLFEDLMLDDLHDVTAMENHADYIDISGPISIALDVAMVIANILPIRYDPKQRCKCTKD